MYTLYFVEKLWSISYKWDYISTNLYQSYSRKYCNMSWCAVWRAPYNLDPVWRSVVATATIKYQQLSFNTVFFKTFLGVIEFKVHPVTTGRAKIVYFSPN